MKKYLGIAIISLFLFWACKKPQGFDYRDVKNIKIDNLGFSKTTLTMDLVYFNPNNFGVTLKNVDCDIFLDKKFLGHYKLDTVMKIDKKSEFNLPSKIEVDMKNIYKNALYVLLNKEVELNVKGSSRVSKFGITINVPFDYKGKHKINIL
ncbi:MAG: LEA type 2 family protein [Chitinophagaceae bacterium]